MDQSSSTNDGTSTGKSKPVQGRNWRGRGFWRPYNSNRNAPKEKPVAIPINSTGTISNNDNNSFDTNNSSVSIAPPQGQHLISFLIEKIPGQYSGWKLYFPQETFMKGSKTAQQIQAFEKHIVRHNFLYDLIQIKQLLSFPVNLENLIEDQIFCQDWPSFDRDLLETPENVLACFGLAMHQKLNDIPDLTQNNFDEKYSCLQIVRARIYGHGPVGNIRCLKPSSYGKLASVRGTVIKVDGSRILCSWLAFKCALCHSDQAVRQTDGKTIFPTSCCKNGCRAKSNFTPLLSSPFTRTEAYQIIKLQDIMKNINYDASRIVATIEVELFHDLVDSVYPGDEVTVTGILKVKPQEDFQRKDRASVYKPYLRGITIISDKNSKTHRNLEFTEKDLKAVKLIKEEPCPFRLLVHSLCPNIYGHEMVKAGLLLGLFGGSSNLKTGRRSESHILVVGDPGLGKSRMLKACANVSPRGIYVSGNNSSHAGLTVMVKHEKESGASIEAGALVLADQGACCIDEFDKITANHQSLLEVMEQQVVSVTKAGIHCVLPAKTSILAAANPSGGHYDRSKTVAENLKMGPALLSRFDLVFILIDQPNEPLDDLLIQAFKAASATNASSSSLFSGGNQSASFMCSDNNVSLNKRLQLLPGENIDHLPHCLFQKYIAFAKKNSNPILSPEAALLIKEFYKQLRQAQYGNFSIPITTRQLEGFIRLTQSRARIDLSEVATLQHAQDVLAIFTHSMNDVFSTDTGDIQLERSINGCGMSKSGQIKKFLKLLQSRSTSLNKRLFSLNELREVAVHGGLQENFTNILDSLNIQGFLLKNGQNFYKFSY